MSKSTQSNGSAAAEQNFPLFYKKPVPLQADVHANLGIQPNGTYEFARATNAIPLTIAEFPLAARQYPIVFVGEENPMPVAIVGLRKDENLMVSLDGSWEQGCYIPAYVRRYPFTFVHDNTNNRFAMCVDMDAEQVAEGADVPLFSDGKPTEVTQKALKFCETLQQQLNATRAASQVLAGHGLLQAHSGKFTTASGEEIGLAGLKIISEAKLAELSDEAYLAMRKNGVLGAVHCHMVSLNGWSDMVGRASR